MAKEQNECKNVRYILKSLGYRQVRLTGSEEWLSLDEIGDRFGTTDETSVISEPNGTEGHADLLDGESGDLLGDARRPESNAQNVSEQETAGRSEAERLEELASETEAPNLCTAAYLAGLTFREEAESPGHKALVTSANIAALRAGREGVGLADLDGVRFGTCQPEERVAIELAGPGGSVTVPVEERDASLERPWGGAYSITKAFGTRG